MLFNNLFTGLKSTGITFSYLYLLTFIYLCAVVLFWVLSETFYRRQQLLGNTLTAPVLILYNLSSIVLILNFAGVPLLPGFYVKLMVFSIILPKLYPASIAIIVVFNFWIFYFYTHDLKSFNNVRSYFIVYARKASTVVGYYVIYMLLFMLLVPFLQCLF